MLRYNSYAPRRFTGAPEHQRAAARVSTDGITAAHPAAAVHGELPMQSFNLVSVLPADSHLRMGLTYDAMVSFMERIGWDPHDGPGNAYVRPEADATSTSNTRHGDHRENLSWVTSQYGPYTPPPRSTADASTRTSGRTQSTQRIESPCMPQMPSVWAHRNAQEVTPLQYVEDEVTPLQYADDEVTPLQYAGDTQLPPPTMNELQQDFMHLMEGFQASQESEVENEEDEHSTDDELDISSNSHGLTGYDFAAAVQSWLKAQRIMLGVRGPASGGCRGRRSGQCVLLTYAGNHNGRAWNDHPDQPGMPDFWWLGRTGDACRQPLLDQELYLARLLFTSAVHG